MQNQEKKVLITGGTGLLGRYLIETRMPGSRIIASYVGDYEMPENTDIIYRKADMRDNEAVRKMFETFKPDVVIHTAAVGSPDFAERNQELTREINVGGTKNILFCAKEFNSAFIYISSNGIYDGEHAPYGEDDPARPVNVYGEIKLEAEEIVTKSKLKQAIVRPILMYGWNDPHERPNIVSQSLAKLRKGEKLFVYDDVYCNPLYARNCALSIWKMISDDKYDSYNVAGADRVSIHQLIITAARVFGCREDLVQPVKDGFFKELAKRPKDTSFVTDKMTKVLGCQPLSLMEGLIMMKDAEKSI